MNLSLPNYILGTTGWPDPDAVRNIANTPRAYTFVWLVHIPPKGTNHGRLLGIYTSVDAAWEAIASTYRAHDRYREFELAPERVALDTWLGD